MREAQLSVSHKLDGTFYFKGNYVTFLIEETLFRLPQHLFTSMSEVFRTMFTLPQGDTDAPREGSSNATPIKLEGVLVADFRALLKLLCPTGIPAQGPWGLEEWTSILHLASLWAMEPVEKYATRQLECLLLGDRYAIKNILLGKRFQKHEWLIRGYDALVRRQEAITESEAGEIGWRSAIKVFQLREKRPSASVAKCPISTCRGAITPRCFDCSNYLSLAVPGSSTSEAIKAAFLDEYKSYPSYS